MVQPVITLHKLVKVLSTYPGRDKSIRTAYFTLVLWSSKMTPERQKIILALAKQLSQTRLVLRQLNHPSMFQASRDMILDAKSSTDPVDFTLNGIITASYTVYGFFELIAWLADAGVITANAAKWFHYCLYLWLIALFAGIVKAIRTVILKTLRGKDLFMDRLTLVGLCSDFISGINSLPFKFLWSGKLTKQTTATCSLIASGIGLYKLLV